MHGPLSPSRDLTLHSFAYMYNACTVYNEWYIMYIQCTMDDMHCTVYMRVWVIVYTLYDSHYKIYSIMKNDIHITIYCTLYSVQYTLYIIPYILYNVHCTLYNVHCIMYNVHCTVYGVQYTSLYCTLYSVNATINIYVC